jgi:cold-inducible RNA-binding protein
VPPSIVRPKNKNEVKGMYIENMTTDCLTIVATFSLTWFLVGLLVGRQMPRQQKQSHKPRPPRRSREDRPQEGGKVEIYIGNLSYEVDEKDVLKAFEAYGKVLSARIIENKFNGKSKGFGFVEMANRAEAVEAIKALNGKEMKGRRIVVNEARSQPRD